MNQLYRDTTKAFFFLLSLSLVIGNIGNAAAQACFTDAECSESEFCEMESIVEMCQNPEPGNEWVCEGYEDVSGHCQDRADRCQEDSECEENYACEKDRVVMTSGCAPGQDCSANKPVDYTSRFGRCEPQPIKCENDDDCPSPLFCESEDHGVCWTSTNGESGCTEDIVKRCAYQPAVCENDDDCESGYECIEVETEGLCYSTSDEGIDFPEPASIPEECPEGDCDNPVEPEPMTLPDVDCEPEIQRFCFPVRVDCEDDDDCSEGNTCIDFSEYEESPSWWADGEVAVACLPVGLVMLLSGHVDSSAGFGSSVGIAISEGTATQDNAGGLESASNWTNDSGSVGDEDIGPDGENEDLNKADGEDDSNGSSNGCSVAVVGYRGTTTAVWIMLIGFVLVLRNKRKRSVA